MQSIKSIEILKISQEIDSVQNTKISLRIGYPIMIPIGNFILILKMGSLSTIETEIL